MNRKTITQVIVFLFIIIAVTSIVRITQGKNKPTGARNNTITKEQQALIEEMSTFLILPQDEVPTIATVADKNRLNSQPIFADAQNGDTLIAYPVAKKLILYRSQQKLIIAIASIHD